jgi:hypothetical protein
MAEHTAYMGDVKNAYKILVIELERKRPPGRPKNRQKDNVNMELEKYDVRTRTGFNWFRTGYMV